MILLQTILTGIFAIVCGIAANLLTPTARKALNLPEPLQEEQDEQEQEQEQTSDATDDNLEVRRARNRERLNELITQCYFYGMSFYVLFAAIYLPLLFKQLGSNEPLPFSTTRLPLSGTLASANFVTLALFVALILYVPCWLLAVRAASIVARILHKYQEVTPIRFGAFVTLAMFVFGLFICGNWIYLLYPQNSYFMSVLLPFIAIVFAAGLASSRR